MGSITKYGVMVGAAFLVACGSEDGDLAGEASAGKEDSAQSAKVETAWADARATSTSEGYAAFVESHPDTKYAREAAARARIFEIGDINMSVNVAAPEGQFMKSAPPVMGSDGTLTPSRSVASVPEGTTLNLSFSTIVDGQAFNEDLVATFDTMEGDRLVFRNDAGDCLWHDVATGGLGYCDGAAPPPPSPDDIAALMPYAWLVVAQDR
ncbi:MAG: hypothetical protein AAGA09_07320 [Pseudomonadota bacterium]